MGCFSFWICTEWKSVRRVWRMHINKELHLCTATNQNKNINNNKLHNNSNKNSAKASTNNNTNTPKINSSPTSTITNNKNNKCIVNFYIYGLMMYICLPCYYFWCRIPDTLTVNHRHIASLSSVRVDGSEFVSIHINNNNISSISISISIRLLFM